LLPEISKEFGSYNERTSLSSIYDQATGSIIMANVRAIPEGRHAVTPYIVVRDAAKAMDWYKKAFGATEVSRMPSPDGKVMHGELRIGDSLVFIADEFPNMGSKGVQSYGGSPVGIHLYVTNTDATFQAAVAAGATAQMPPANMFWGDRFAKIQDPFGMGWSISTHIEDVSPQEMGKRAAAAFCDQKK
jgi:PhnB protein